MQTCGSGEGAGICNVQVGHIPALPLPISHRSLGGGSLAAGSYLMSSEMRPSVRLISCHNIKGLASPAGSPGLAMHKE